MPAPLPSLESAVRTALEFTKKFPIVTVTIFQARKAGTPHILAYEPFVGRIEPHQGKRGMLYFPVGTIKAGRVVS